MSKTDVSHFRVLAPASVVEVRVVDASEGRVSPVREDALLVLTVPAGEPEATIGFRILVAGTLTVGLVPLAILSSFILRTATVTRLTAATLPFTTPEQER